MTGEDNEVRVDYFSQVGESPSSVRYIDDDDSVQKEMKEEARS